MHHYHLRAYALDEAVTLGPQATKGKLLAAVKGHVLAMSELVGTDERR